MLLLLLFLIRMMTLPCFPPHPVRAFLACAPARMLLLASLAWGSAFAASATPATPAITVTLPATATGLQQPAQAQFAWQAPPNTQMDFVVTGKAKGFAYTANAQLRWQVEHGQYEAAQEVRMPLLGSRRQSSVGRTGPQGVQPGVFIDRGSKEERVSFDTSAGQIVFSRGSPAAPWQAGTQDRLSVFFQIAGMLQAAPSSYPPGTQILVQAASKRSIKPWLFVVQQAESVQLPAGKLQTLKLSHYAADNLGMRQPSESALWLAPQLGYLPVRIRMQESAQDMLDLQLQALPKELQP